MILTDGKHVASTKDLKELHTWAKASRITRSYFRHGRIPHYTMAPKHRGSYLAEARQVSTRDLVRMVRGAKVTADDDVEDTPTRGRRKERKCDFCRGPLDKSQRYIYPVPGSTDPFVGKTACGTCAPDLEQAQFEQGLVIPVKHGQVATYRPD